MITWKSGNFVYPIPAVMVSVGNMEKSNIITVAWTGTINTNPAMLYISVRKERYSYNIIKETKEFVINLTTEDLTYATDFCGVKSGRDIDKFEKLHLTKQKANHVNCPIIKESPISIECKVVEEHDLGSHTMFMANVLAINVDEMYLDEKGSFDISKCNLIAYANGGYYTLGEKIGKFGFSVAKKNKNDFSKKNNKSNNSKRKAIIEKKIDDNKGKKSINKRSSNVNNEVKNNKKKYNKKSKSNSKSNSKKNQHK